MFDVAPTELLLLGAVAIVVIPPKDLPKAMRAAGYWIGRARGVTRQFRAGFDNLIRESELEEMEKKWKAENERIMREHPTDITDVLDPATPPPPPALIEQQPALAAPDSVADASAGPNPDPDLQSDDAPPEMVAQPSLFPPPEPPKETS